MMAADSTPTRVVALLVAGGRGGRFGGEAPKQFVLLGGRPLVTHAAATLDVADAIDGYIVVAPVGLESRTREVLEAVHVTRRLWAVVTGGATRQESVWNGLQAAGDVSIVVVHDAARPFVTAELVADSVAAAAAAGASTVAIPISDTLLRVDASDVVSSAEGEVSVVASGTRVDRDRLWSVQTPQAFRAEVLRSAHRDAASADPSATATDDSGLVLAAGGHVALVPGPWWNLKITTAADLAQAEAILRLRHGGL